MTSGNFEIEFRYDEVSYIGLVRPIEEKEPVSYRVSLESENQETKMDIVLRPSGSRLEDWDFFCEDGSRADRQYDKDLLTEIGEQVEEHLLSDNGSSPDMRLHPNR